MKEIVLKFKNIISLLENKQKKFSLHICNLLNLDSFRCFRHWINYSNFIFNIIWRNKSKFFKLSSNKNKLL